MKTGSQVIGTLLTNALGKIVFLPEPQFPMYIMMAFKDPSWYARRTRTICMVFMVVSTNYHCAVLAGGRAIGLDSFCTGGGEKECCYN